MSSVRARGASVPGTVWSACQYYAATSEHDCITAWLQYQTFSEGCQVIYLFGYELLLLAKTMEVSPTRPMQILYIFLMYVVYTRIFITCFMVPTILLN